MHGVQKLQNRFASEFPFWNVGTWVKEVQFRMGLCGQCVTGDLDRPLNPNSVYRNIVQKYGLEAGVSAQVNGLYVHFYPLERTLKAERQVRKLLPTLVPKYEG